MTPFLIALSLGPVQSLIEAARRTRDLWCGSWLLSEAARAAARELHTRQPGCLIFPCPAHPEQDLLPQRGPGDEANMANILRAEVEVVDAAAAQALCDAAKRAAVDRLRELAEGARGRVDGLGAPLRAPIWDAQVGDLLEVFCAWVELTGGERDYAAASARLGGALAARKATQDFSAAPPPVTPGLPKSSLDGAFETVLPDWPESHGARRKLGLSRGEQLDALGVAKRLAGDAEQFTAYSRIAADPWLMGLSEEQRRRLNRAYEPLVGFQLATRVRGNRGAYRALPYDGQLLYEFRLDNAMAGKGLAPEEGQALRTLRRAMAELGADAGAPVPYAAILKADGDHMGELLARADSADGARRISRALQRFAGRVRDIVRDHRGHAIYAGGDDVLAMLPLKHAVRCAAALAKAFDEDLGPVAEQLGVEVEHRPTLSAGIGIGHLLEPLGSLRARADAAEKSAKGELLATDRNALAIRLGIRSGGEYEWRAQWTEVDAFDALARFTGAYREQELPSRVAYDLRGIDRRLAWLRGDGGEVAVGMRRSEIVRLLDRARTDGGKQAIPPPLRGLLVGRAARQPLAALADTLIIARWLSARTAGELGESR